MQRQTIYTSIPIIAAAIVFVSGCLSPEKAERDADAAAVEAATALWREHTGFTNTFDVARPADALTLRIALEALRSGGHAPFPRIDGVAPMVPSGGVVRIGLADALAIGARNNRRYRTLKEDVYSRALSMDTERHEFETTFTSMLLGALNGEPEISKESAGGAAGASRKFEQGATAAGNLALDVARMIRDDWHSFAWSGDLTATLPLMRGSGRDIVRESLTQAERSLAYALHTFVRYRQTYALSVAKAYYGVLRNARSHENSKDNSRRLQLNFNRAEMMFKAGRMTRIEFDQAKTDLLGARQSVITTLQTYSDSLDSFKITLGLSPEVPLALDDAELEVLQRRMDALFRNGEMAMVFLPHEDDAIARALIERRDLAVVRGEVEDAERAVRIAADALRADLTIEGGAAYEAGRRQHGSVDDQTTTDLQVKFSAPWDRRRERNAYRKSLLSLEQRRRSLEEEEDAIKNEVRAGYRALAAARILYENKAEALKTAEMRVEANDLFTQSGRSSMRDILEAENALLNARNALCSAVVEWHTDDLSLRCAMGTLHVDRKGVIQ